MITPAVFFLVCSSGKSIFHLYFVSVSLADLELYFFRSCVILGDSHKKRKDSLKGSLVRVLFATEFEFLKILIPKLTQNASHVNIESTRKSKQLYYLRDQLLGFLIYLHFLVLILICF